MADPFKIGSFIIATDFIEPIWATDRSWVYEAKVDVLETTASPAFPNNTALFNIFVVAQVSRGRTQFRVGSTAFPDDIGDRRIYIMCDVYVETIASVPLTNISLTKVSWQLIGPIT